MTISWHAAWATIRRTTSMGTMTDCVARLATAPPTPLLRVAVCAAVSCARSQNFRHAAFTISSVVRYTCGRPGAARSQETKQGLTGSHSCSPHRGESSILADDATVCGHVTATMDDDISFWGQASSRKRTPRAGMVPKMTVPNPRYSPRMPSVLRMADAVCAAPCVAYRGAVAAARHRRAEQPTRHEMRPSGSEPHHN